VRGPPINRGIYDGAVSGADPIDMPPGFAAMLEIREGEPSRQAESGARAARWRQVAVAAGASHTPRRFRKSSRWCASCTDSGNRCGRCRRRRPPGGVPSALRKAPRRAGLSNREACNVSAQYGSSMTHKGRAGA
jgi:hypothetical protein